jgi:hypothetical protein
LVVETSWLSVNIVWLWEVLGWEMPSDAVGTDDIAMIIQPDKALEERGKGLRNSRHTLLVTTGIGREGGDDHVR